MTALSGRYAISIKICWLILGGSLILAGCFGTRPQINNNNVHVGPLHYWVEVVSPIPEEITNQTQSMALCREAGISSGQVQLLEYVLQLRASSKKLLAEAEIPDIKLQNHIRGTISGAEVMSTKFEKNSCRVKVGIGKDKIKDILKAN